MNRGNDAAVQTLGQLGSGGMNSQQALASVNRMIDQQAYTLAATDVFYMSAVLFIVLIGLIWLAKKPQPSAAGAGGGAH